MKKLISFFITLIALAFPLLSQSIPEDEPEEMLFLKRGNIPAQVLRAADSLFKGESQVGWGVFPYELKQYGWVVDKDFDGPINHYEISIKTRNNGEVTAVFESTGQLVSYRSVEKNRPLPEPIQLAISKTPYRDWTIKKDLETIISNQKMGVKHITVRLEKDGKKKTLYYTLSGEQLVNR